MQAVVLAAGKGTRLGPLTRDRSKAMLPILGKPIITRVIESLDHPPVEEFIVIASPADEGLHDYFNQAKPFNDRVRLVEQTAPLGTGDALNCAAPYIKQDFLVIACDNLLPPVHVQRMLALWEQQPVLEGLLTLLRVSDDQISSTGIVALDGDWVTEIVEKPSPEEAPSNIASPQLYCFSPKLLEYLPAIPRSERGEYELQDAICKLIEEHGQVRGLMAETRLTLTNPGDLLAINKHYLSFNHDTHRPKNANIGEGTVVIPPVFLEDGCEVGRNCRIGPYVYCESGSRVGDNAILQNAVVLRGNHVPSGALVIDRVVN